MIGLSNLKTVRGLKMKTSNIHTQANSFVLTALLLTAVSLNTALSQGVLFTDRSAFNAVTGSKISFDFESLTPTTVGQSTIGVPPFGSLISGGNLYVYPQSYLSPGVPSSSGQYVGAFDGAVPMTISGPTTRNAFGADFSGGLFPGNFTGTLTFNLIDGSSESFQFQGIRDGWTFFGVVLPENISSVIFDDGGNSFPGSHQERIDNITYGVAAVPEPGIAALLLLGGFSCSLLGRKNRRF
jgi:hypothetical protein